MTGFQHTLSAAFFAANAVYFGLLGHRVGPAVLTFTVIVSLVAAIRESLREGGR